MVSQDRKSPRTGGRPTSFDCMYATNIAGLMKMWILCPYRFKGNNPILLF